MTINLVFILDARRFSTPGQWLAAYQGKTEAGILEAQMDTYLEIGIDGDKTMAAYFRRRTNQVEVARIAHGDLTSILTPYWEKTD